MMRTIRLAAALAAILPALAGAAELPPGVTGARLLAPAPAADGALMTALEITLAPGWKTYWRSPGDSGIPPTFDWSRSQNLGAAQPLWPAPEVIQSGQDRTLGYHDRLLLPVQLTPQRAGDPVALRLVADFGVCRDICVPAHVELSAPPPQARPDPQVAEALARLPSTGRGAPRCNTEDIPDGVRLTATLPPLEEPAAGVAAPAPAAAPPSAAAALPAAAMELETPGVWVSAAEVAAASGGLTATADFVAPSGKPFALDRNALRLTLIGADGRAVEYRGCQSGG